MRNLYSDDKIKYIRNLFAQEDDILLKIKRDELEVRRPININPEEGKLLQILIKLANCKKILEIGTFYGYSTIWLARIIEDGRVYTIEKDIESIEKAKENFKLANLQNKIEIIEGKAEDILPTLNEEFDMVFIDAEKIRYLEYLDWADKHIIKNGLIVADNTLLSGSVYSDELPFKIRRNTRKIIKEFNERIADKNKYLSVMLPAEDGFTIAIKLF
jgi:predicted O-methyltransferase YrrM